MSRNNKSSKDDGAFVSWIIGLGLGFTLSMGLGDNPWIAGFCSILTGLGFAILYVWAKKQ